MSPLQPLQIYSHQMTFLVAPLAKIEISWGHNTLELNH